MWLLGAYLFVLGWDLVDALCSAHAEAAHDARRKARREGFAEGFELAALLPNPEPPRWPRVVELLVAGALGLLLGVLWAFLVLHW